MGNRRSHNFRREDYAGCANPILKMYLVWRGIIFQSRNMNAWYIFLAFSSISKVLRPHISRPMTLPCFFCHTL